MLRVMTTDKKSKEERIKFLKLMGYPKAEEYWDDVEMLIIQKKNQPNHKKAS